MNSNQTKQANYAIFTAAALMLSLTGARAQVVSTPYGNLPYGAKPVGLSPSAPYTANRYNTNTQNYSVFGGTNGVAAFPVGALNNGYGYGFYGLGGSTSPLASAAYFGYGLPTAFAGYPFGYAVSGLGSLYAGSNISVIDSPLSGGFSVVNPNGAYFVGPNGQLSDPVLTNGGSVSSLNGNAGGITRLASRNSRNTNSKAGNGSGMDMSNAGPVSLNQMIGATQDASLNLRIKWLGDPALIDAMNVTLLNQYHLPVVSNTASNGKPVTFAASPDVYAAQYYRVDIQFTDGAVTTVTGKIKR